MEITQDYLKECLDYDPLTGVFTWRNRPDRRKNWNATFAGKQTGYANVSKRGYTHIIIGLNYKLYLASRLAFLYMTGAWPQGQVDHINQISTDNRWANLRDVSDAENRKNRTRQSNNTSGVQGVYWHTGTGKWRARLWVNKKSVSGGLFNTFEEAVARRKELEAQYNFHANHGSEKLAA